MKKVCIALHFSMRSPSPGARDFVPMSPRARSRNVRATFARKPSMSTVSISDKRNQSGEDDEKKRKNAPPKWRRARIWRRGTFAAVFLDNTVDAAKRKRKTARRSRKRRRRAQ